MIKLAVSTSNPICLVGGGTIFPSDFDDAKALTQGFVAVDSGADAVLSKGYCPQAVIGDLDSLSEATLAKFEPEIVYHISEQDSTDFEKALSRVAAPVVLAIGFTGGRLDHQLAVLHALVRFADKPCVLLGEHEIIVHCPPRLQLTLDEADVVSLFPLRDVQGRSEGLRWPINGLDFAPGEKIGTSNSAIGGRCTIEMKSAGMICLLPRARLAQVMSVMQRCAQERALWPAL